MSGEFLEARTRMEGACSNRGSGGLTGASPSPFELCEAMRAPVRVDSLLPYRVTAAMDWSGYVETSRVWLPGYEAKVDGLPVEVRSSPERLAMVAVPEGQHTIELRYTGTTALRAAWWISALTWSGWIGFFAWRLKKKM